jgi:hypothetical protein
MIWLNLKYARTIAADPHNPNVVIVRDDKGDSWRVPATAHHPLQKESPVAARRFVQAESAVDGAYFVAVQHIRRVVQEEDGSLTAIDDLDQRHTLAPRETWDGAFTTDPADAD